jgi:hypothetical protein
MTKEQLEIAVKLSRSLKQLESILDCLNVYKDEVWYISSFSLSKDELEMPDILRTEFIKAVKDCIKRTENKIKEL